MAQVTIRDTGDLKRLAKDFRQASNGKELRKEFTTQVRAVLRPVVDEVKGAYRAGPSQGHEGWGGVRKREPGLRTMLAKVTQMQVRTSGKQAGVRLRVSGKRMPSGYRGLPKAVEGQGRPWRHPVFGDRTTWVQQPSRPEFYPVVERHVDDVARAVEAARDEVARKLERGTA
jgi:hypothetical protein